MKPEDIPNDHSKITEAKGIFDHENYIYGFFPNGLLDLEFDPEETKVEEKKSVQIYIHRSVIQQMIEDGIKKDEGKDCKVNVLEFDSLSEKK